MEQVIPHCSTLRGKATAPLNWSNARPRKRAASCWCPHTNPCKVWLLTTEGRSTSEKNEASMRWYQPQLLTQHPWITRVHGKKLKAQHLNSGRWSPAPQEKANERVRLAVRQPSSAPAQHDSTYQPWQSLLQRGRWRRGAAEGAPQGPSWLYTLTPHSFQFLFFRKGCFPSCSPHPWDSSVS